MWHFPYDPCAPDVLGFPLDRPAHEGAARLLGQALGSFLRIFASIPEQKKPVIFLMIFDKR